ncbi:AAA family ATPase [Archangium violaceum]|uniref:AAA family ATPase n=1 Tax=Archangium violaceum TaxID=83451 RepID=UPI000695F207|nr:AAA family ATPase [Archangium violaceum]
MTRGLVTTSRYSPGNMSGQALEQLFVGRDALMKDILKRITASATRKEKHYILLVGARGMGKTHFVSLAAHKLKNDEAYAAARARLKIAYLNEEEWGVASFLDLLVRILRALYAQEGTPGLSASLDRIYEAFKQSPEAALRTAESLLIDYIRGSTLLLICENLSDLFEGLGDEGQKRWRSFIQEHPFWTILATTPALFSGVRLQSSPFYNFFTIKSLERLDFDTATELLRQKALLEGRSGLADFLLTPTGRARVRAIHHLAGGNHRVYVILSDFLDEESLEELIGPFMRMADDLTPYYQDRMRQLTPQQRKIIELLCQEARPIIVKDLAMRCLISQQVTAKQLGELAKLQFVLSTKVGRESYYELAEPLMRICVDIKDNRTEHFKLFVEFLRHWFSGRELRTKLDLLKQTGPETRRVDRLHITAALQDFAQDPREPFLEHLDAEAQRCIKAQDYQGLVDAMPRLLQERPSPGYYYVLAWAMNGLHRFEDALEVATKGAAQYPDEVPLLIIIATSLVHLGRVEEALEVEGRALSLNPEEPLLIYDYANLLEQSGRKELATEHFRRAFQLASNDRAHIETFAQLAHDLGRHAEAEQAYRKYLELAPDEPLAFRGLFLSLNAQDKHDEAVSLAELAPEKLSADPVAIASYGRSLAILGRHKDALAQLDKAIESNPGDVWSHVFRAIDLYALGRTEDAARAGLNVLALHPDEHATEITLDFLIGLGRPSEVLSWIDEFEKREEKKALFRKQRAGALLRLSRYKEALAVAESAKQEAPEDKELTLLEIEALTGSAGFGAAMSILDRTLHGIAESVNQDVLATSLRDVLAIEQQLRGVVAMARQVPQLRMVLDKHQQGGLMPAILSELLDHCLEEDLLADDAWTKAIPPLQEALADRPDCRIPLDMLSVAARYRQSGDRSVLLELPLEQRSLLLEKLGTKDESPPSA